VVGLGAALAPREVEGGGLRGDELAKPITVAESSRVPKVATASSDPITATISATFSRSSNCSKKLNPCPSNDFSGK